MNKDCLDLYDIIKGSYDDNEMSEIIKLYLWAGFKKYLLNIVKHCRYIGDFYVAKKIYMIILGN